MPNEIQIIEYKNERVLTTEQLAEAYGCEGRNISDNFKNNESHFQEGKHYFRLAGEDLKAFKRYSENIGLPLNKFSPVFYLWTKQGAARHCKMLGTDQAWDMFDQLEESYFNPQPKQMTPLEMIRELADAAIKQEKQLAEHEARLVNIEQDKAQINSAIKEIQEKVEQKAYPYPDKKRRDKIRNSVWTFAKENLDFFVSNDNAVGENDVVNRINVSFQDDFIEKYGIDLSKELESAKLYYIGKYTQLKLDKMLTPDILRPAKIRDLSVQALISTSADWTNKAMSLLAGYKSQIKKTRNLYVVA